jgi:hypothetical protein
MALYDVYRPNGERLGFIEMPAMEASRARRAGCTAYLLLLPADRERALIDVIVAAAARDGEQRC